MINQTVKVRKVGEAIVVGVPSRMAEAFGIEPGDYLRLSYNPVVGATDKLILTKEEKGSVILAATKKANDRKFTRRRR